MLGLLSELSHICSQYSLYSLFSLFSLFSLHSLHSLYSQYNIPVTLINRGGYEEEISVSPRSMDSSPITTSVCPFHWHTELLALVNFTFNWIFRSWFDPKSYISESELFNFFIWSPSVFFFYWPIKNLPHQLWRKLKRRIGEIGSNIAAKTGAGSNAVIFSPEDKTRYWTRPIAQNWIFSFKMFLSTIFIMCDILLYIISKPFSLSFINKTI